MPAPTSTPSGELVVSAYAITATNPDPGGYAAVWSDGQSQGHWSAHVEESAAVRLEMLAIIDALERIPPSPRVRVLTGMQHIADAMTNDSVAEWRANDWRRTSARGGVVANADHWEALDDLVQRSLATIEFVHGLPKGTQRDRCRKLAGIARNITDGTASPASKPDESQRL